jgi:hypothetical protein
VKQVIGAKYGMKKRGRGSFLDQVEVRIVGKIGHELNEAGMGLSRTMMGVKMKEVVAAKGQALLEVAWTPTEITLANKLIAAKCGKTYIA